jgi:hypothetical protein
VLTGVSEDRAPQTKKICNFKNHPEMKPSGNETRTTPEKISAKFEIHYGHSQQVLIPS